MGVIRTTTVCLVLLFAFTGTAAAATSLDIETKRPVVTFGSAVRLSGSASPAGTAEALVVQRQTADGAWHRFRSVTTRAATGLWSLTTSPRQSARYRVRTRNGAVASDPVRVAVAPVVTLRTGGTARPFVGAPVSVRVVPSSYSGPVILQSRSAMGRTSRRIPVRGGRATGLAPVNRVGRVRITARTTATSQLASGSDRASARVKGRTLRRGTKGRDVAKLMKHLQQLGFLVPRDGRRYTFAASEVTMAFHKVYGMRRSYVWGQRSWQRISRLTHGPQPRFGGKRTHVEVNKTRQFMMIVRNGRPISIIHVSTGRTGNTPVGDFRIINRRPEHLPYFEGFIGNFGLHGYYSVPPYPASHGCVREPIWAARFTWKHTGIGTPVHIYR